MDKSEKFWDRLAKNFDKGGDQYEQSYISTITKHLEIGDIVLDFACGTGSFSCLIADKVKEIHAIDISSKMLVIAKRKAAERKIENINFVQSTIFDERHAIESFDVILAFNILHLLEDTPKVIQRVNELLKPGGLFFFDTVCTEESKSWLSFFLSILSKTGIVPNINHFKISELDGIITKGDFQIIESEILNQTPSSRFLIAEKI